MRTSLLFVLAAALVGCSKKPANELQELLVEARFESLENQLKEWEGQHSRGELSDLQLRTRYRQFDRMPPAVEIALNRWVESAPRSHFALVVRGYHHRSHAFWIRGNGVAREISAQQWESVQSRLKLAEQDMSASLQISPASLLSHYVLLDVAGLPCDKQKLIRYFDAANVAVPASPLLYARQLNYLKPRWCGSEAEMEDFIAQSKTAGVSEKGRQQLRAIVEDDLGRTLLDKKTEDDALVHLVRAAELGQPFGWEFRRESLFALNEYACKLPGLKAYCITSELRGGGT